jgi:DNA-binding response OmpR family regulator
MASERRRIFLVEDEYLITVLIGDMLAELGHDLAETADRLDSALTLARDGSFDLAHIDLTLKGAVTYPVAAALVSRGVPFAFVTGRGAEDIDPAYAGIPVLRKPFRRRDLTEIVTRLEQRL